MKPALTLSFAATIAAFAAISDVSAFGCKPDEVKGWMASCDLVVNISPIKCDNKQCHTALHRLVEQETIDCYVKSGLGLASDLAKYKTLDDFCHGEGPDPTELSAESSAPPKTNQTTTDTGSGSADASASVVKNDTTATVPATTSAVVPSPSPSPSSAGNNVAVASTVVFSATIALSLVTTL